MADDEACVECGSTTRVERVDGTPYCIVHRDGIEDADAEAEA